MVIQAHVPALVAPIWSEGALVSLVPSGRTRRRVCRFRYLPPAHKSFSVITLNSHKSDQCLQSHRARATGQGWFSTWPSNESSSARPQWPASTQPGKGSTTLRARIWPRTLANTALQMVLGPTFPRRSADRQWNEMGYITGHVGVN